MYGLLLGIHLLVCLCLVAMVLVQSGKGGGLAGGAFGSATQTVFGGRGGTDFVTRATIVLGVLFFPFVWVISFVFIKRSIALEEDEVTQVKGGKDHS